MKKLVYAACIVVGICALVGLLYALRPHTVTIRSTSFDSDAFKLADPADLLPYEPAVCEVHHVDMRAEVVPIQYGTPISMFHDKDGKRLLAPGEIDPDIRQSLFPHAAHWTWGGCVVSNLDPKTARIHLCPECERAEQKWRADHPDSK